MAPRTEARVRRGEPRAGQGYVPEEEEVMPTGYTAELHDKGQSFEEFVWTCARAFGGLLHMREDDLNAPLRLHAEEGRNYGAETLKEEQAELERLRKLSRGDCD